MSSYFTTIGVAEQADDSLLWQSRA